jgi:HSF-type DNA-binding
LLDNLVHDKEAFTKQIMPKYFETSTWKSYQRNINLWNFHTIRKGNNKGYTSHPCFRRGDIDLCKDMTRVRVKGTGKKRGITPSEDEDSGVASPARGSQLNNHAIGTSSRYFALLRNLASLSHGNPPHLASILGCIESSASDIRRPCLIDPRAAINGGVTNAPWLGTAPLGSPAGATSLANVAALSQIVAATNGLRAQNIMFSALLPQPERLGSRLPGVPPIVGSSVFNTQHKEAVMAGLLCLALNAKRQEATATPG